MSVAGLCLLGTDTGVGKTALGAGLLRLARRRGVRLRPYKPVETGCASTPTDVARLVEAAADSGVTAETAGTYRFDAPVAPSVAARLAGRIIDPGLILRRARELMVPGGQLLVETAGGLLTPYGPSFTSTSVAELLFDHFAFDVLLVTANRLGTINQTALAVSYLAGTRCRLAGVVLVDVSAEHTPDHPFNGAEIHALTGARILGTLRHCAPPTADAVADALAADVDLRPILGGALAS
jgi:dethiobiotin synthetase